MRRAAAVAIGAALACAPAAIAKQMSARVPDEYSAKEVDIAAGEALTFVNDDIDRHDVTADDLAPGGAPLFRSRALSTGEQGPVAGVESLVPGRYGFHCSLHTFMTGTVVVTGTTPAPAPGTPAPQLSIVTRSPAAARKGVVVSVSGQGDARIAGAALVHHHRFALRTVAVQLAGSRRVRLAPTRAARRALAGARRARVTVTVTVGGARVAAARTLQR